MDLSVIIPCYQAADTIAEQLDALAAQCWSGSWEVVVADNRSTDGSMAIVERYRDRLPNLRIVDASARQGQPYALNTAVAAANGESVAFCDADDQVGSGWVAAMGEALRRYDFVAAAIEVVKLNPRWVVAARGPHPQATDCQHAWYPPYLSHAGGGTLGVRKSLHDAVGGFDEALPICHDTDYCFRIQLRGTELKFVPAAVVHVRYRQTLRGMFRQGRLYAEYNALVYKKHRALGMAFPEPWRRYLLEWKRVLGLVPGVRDREGLASLVWQLGWQLGLLFATVRHHVVPVAWAAETLASSPVLPSMPHGHPDS